MKNSIEITIKLFAQYREGRFKLEKRTYPSYSTVGDIIKDVGINEDEMPIGVMIVNGRHVGKDQSVKDGDTLSIFPKIGGG